MLYDTRGLELEQDVQDQVVSEIKIYSIKHKIRKTKSISLTIASMANPTVLKIWRIEFIEELSKKLPVIVVLTQS